LHVAAASNLHKLNNQDIFDVFGFFVEEGIGEFDTPFPPKKVLEHNWPEVNGLTTSNAPVVFDAKKVSLKCHFLSDNREEFYTKIGILLAEFRKRQWHTWFSVDNNKAYTVRYEGGSNGVKAFGSYLNNKPILSFNLALTVQPEFQEQIDSAIIVNLNGEFYGSYPAGTGIINVETNGGGTALSVNISNVAVNGNTLIVQATGHPDYQIQFSLDNYNWQSSNIFDNAPNGSYTVIARLVGTNTTDTFGPVNVNYTATAPEPSLVITRITVDKNTITVLATPSNTTATVEYSRGGAYQTSNVFTDVPNGTYTIAARLVGTNITATADIEVNYTPTISSYNSKLTPRYTQYGATLYAAAGVFLHFNAPLNTSNPMPQTMMLYLNGSRVARVDFLASSTGAPCALEYNGVLYPIEGGLQKNDNITL